VAASFRFVLAALVFLPFLLRYGFKRPVLVRGGLEVGVYAGIGYWAQAQSLLTTKASTAAFVCSLAVLVVPILDALFVESKRKNFKLVSLLPSLLATTGVACLELGGSEPPSLGDLYSFLQPLFFGLSFWRVEKFMSQDIKEPEDPKVFTGAMMLAVSIFAMIWSLHDVIFPIIRDGSSVELFLTTQLEFLKDWKFLGAILWTGIVTTALTSFGENIAMQRLSAAESTIIYSTEPLWGSAFAAVVLGEHIGVNTLFGAILILASCLWSSLGSEVIITYLLGLGTFYQNLLGEEATEVIKKLLENFSKIFGNVEDF
jgi:drug/metabolite transporter (DMT)-like permease